MMFLHNSKSFISAEKKIVEYINSNNQLQSRHSAQKKTIGAIRGRVMLVYFIIINI